MTTVSQKLGLTTYPKGLLQHNVPMTALGHSVSMAAQLCFSKGVCMCVLVHVSKPERQRLKERQKERNTTQTAALASTVPVKVIKHFAQEC